MHGSENKKGSFSIDEHDVAVDLFVCGKLEYGAHAFFQEGRLWSFVACDDERQSADCNDAEGRSAHRQYYTETNLMSVSQERFYASSSPD